MSKGSVDSKIPVFNRKPISTRISRPFSNLSNRVLAHLTPVDSCSNGKRPGSPSSVILGILNSGSSARKSRSNSVTSTTDLQEDQLNHIGTGDVGKRVNVSNEKYGTLQYVGTAQFGSGIWCGIELDVPNGLNDGSVGNTRYFTCKSNHGIFVPVEKVKLYESCYLDEDIVPESSSGLKESDVPNYASQKCNLKLDLTSTTGRILEKLTFTPDPESQLPSHWGIDSKLSASIGSLVAKKQQQQHCSNQHLDISKHNSLDLDESLGILTPDQMADFTMTDESFHRTISCEVMNNMASDFKTDPSSASLKITDMMSDNTNMESTPVEDMTMNGLMELDDCLSSKSEFLHMDNQELAGSLETSSSYYLEHGKNNENNINYNTDRTPSIEDLPMDGIIPQESSSENASNSTGNNTQLIPNPNSFITSVTSIASLDNGYQGDGELSRPTSRGADHSPTAHQNVKLKVIDSMTDSDFFTESDADIHEDLGRGDRRAQVIDGVIYGGGVGLPNQSPGTQRRKSGTYSQITEEMESSGVYSDLERKLEDTLQTTLIPLNENIDPKMESCDIQPIIELIHDTSPSEGSITTNMDETVLSTETLQNSSSPDLKKNITSVSNSKKCKTEVPNKKFKMPNRNVTSKVKSMISNTPVRKTPDDESQENRKPKSNKKGKWDAVMDKIAQGQNEKKNTPRIKEVKSKVFAQINLNSEPINNSSSKRIQQKELPIKHSNSSRSLRETNEIKAKKRTRVRSTELASQTSGRSQASSRNSSVTDLSEQNSTSLSNKISSSSSVSSHKGLLKKHANNNETQARISSPVSDETGGKLTLPRLKESVTSRSTGNISTPQTKAANNVKSITNRKQQIRPLRENNRIGSSTQRNKTDANSNNVQQTQRVVRTTTTSSTIETRTSPTQPPQPPAPKSKEVVDLLPQLRHALTTVDALGILVQYLSVNLDAFSNPILKSELEKMRRDWMKSKTDLDEAQAAYKQIQEEYSSEKLKFQEDLTEVKKSHEETVQSLEETHQAKLLRLAENYDEEKSSLQNKLQNETEIVRTELREEILKSERKHIEEYEALRIEMKTKLETLQKESETKYTKLMDDYTKTTNEMRQKISRLESEKETLGLQYDAVTKSEAPNKSSDSKLNHEIESLHHVLDLRNKDISDLRMQNAFLAQDVEDLPNVRTRLTAANTRIEDLTIQLERKTDLEQELLTENRSLKNVHKVESAKVQTLLRQNEELQWALKQKSEALNVLAHSTPKKQMPSPCNGKKACDTNEKREKKRSREEEIISPPTSPKVMGVVEKNESVSWVVELEETPDNIVSKVLQRANSFRSVNQQQHQSPRKPNNNNNRCIKQTKSSSAIPNTKQHRVRSVSVPVDHEIDENEICWEGEMSKSADNSLTESNNDDDDAFNIETKKRNIIDMNKEKNNYSIDDIQSDEFITFNKTINETNNNIETSLRQHNEEFNDDLLVLGSVPKDSAGEAMISSDDNDDDDSSRTTSSCSNIEDISRSSNSSLSVEDEDEEDDEDEGLCESNDGLAAVLSPIHSNNNIDIETCKNGGGVGGGGVVVSGSGDGVDIKCQNIQCLSPILPKKKSKFRNDDKLIQNFSHEYHSSQASEHRQL